MVGHNSRLRVITKNFTKPRYFFIEKVNEQINHRKVSDNRVAIDLLIYEFYIATKFKRQNEKTFRVIRSAHCNKIKYSNTVIYTIKPSR